MSDFQERRPSVIIATEIRLYREGLATILEKDGRLTILDTCVDTSEALEMLSLPTIDAILLDTSMEGALEFVRRVGRRNPSIHVIALGLNEDADEILPSIEAGVSGYVCQHGTVDDVVQAVLCAQNDEMICSREIAATLQRRIARLASRFPDPETTPIFTPRELQIARSLELGMSNKEIARSLHITVSTVKNHVHNVLKKLCARTRLEAAAKFRAIGDIAKPASCRSRFSQQSESEIASI